MTFKNGWTSFRKDEGVRPGVSQGASDLGRCVPAGTGGTRPMRQQCGNPVTIHRRESEGQTVANRAFCHQIGTPFLLREKRRAVPVPRMARV